MNSIVSFSLKVFFGALIFWVVSLSVILFSGGLLDSYLEKRANAFTKSLAGQLASSLKEELISCEVSPQLTLQDFIERTNDDEETKEEKDDWQDLSGFFNYDSDDLVNFMSLYLDATTFGIKCGPSLTSAGQT